MPQLSRIPRFRARTLACLLALAAAPSLSGCASVGLSSMSASAVGLGSKATGEAVQIPLFVASTRRDDRQDSAGYEAPRSNARFSFALVSVPPGHKPGVIERPSFGKASPQSHFVLAETQPVETDQFSSQLATHLSGRVGSSRDVLIFVHGFNTSLDEARFRLAQLVNDGRFGGVPVLFTWPSRDNVFAYGSAKENATISRDALSRLMRDVSQTPGVGRVHVLAHSMGGWLAMEALRETAIGGQHLLDGRLGNVMLAAPDIDISVFRQQMARLGSGANVAVFSSTGDRALSLSSTLAGDRPRLGAIDPNSARDRAELERLGVKVYDLSSISDGLINHGAYASAPQVIRQIGAQLSRQRADDSQVTSVIDAGVDKTPDKPLPGAIERSQLPAPGQ
ncbi:MAG: protein of unknown function hydrolase family protein [Hyphomicrobiales bacterium]|jgi:esterase/lipase superfamily enzyme|nr:protein of unknown function hydrolase family protein [Hyphomicrobiales bacterium]